MSQEQNTNLLIYALCKALEHAAVAGRIEQAKELCAALQRQCQATEVAA